MTRRRMTSPEDNSILTSEKLYGSCYKLRALFSNSGFLIAKIGREVDECNFRYRSSDNVEIEFRVISIQYTQFAKIETHDTIILHRILL